MDGDADTLVGMLQRLRDGRITSEAAVRSALARARGIGATLGVFIELFESGALRDARRIDRTRRSGGDAGPLGGVPVAVKDVFELRGRRPTAGSAVDLGAGDRRDAGAVVALREAGGIPIGATSMPEFGLGRPDGPAPTTRNPWDPERWAGGSSSGSAATVAAGIVPAALGTDTVGSVRLPAAFCGVVGMVPTPGLLPADGVVPVAPSLDRIGVLTRTVGDARALLEALGGLDTPAAGSERADPGALRLGVVDGFGLERSDPMVRRAFDTAVAALVSAGASVEHLRLPGEDDFGDALFVLLARESRRALRQAIESNRTAIDPGTLAIPLAGDRLSEPDEAGARADAAAIADAAAHALRPFDATLTVTAGRTAPTLAAARSAPPPDRARFRHATAGYANLAGLPAVAVPMGLVGGLPVSLQLLGAPGRDARLLEVAARHERLGEPPTVPPRE